MKCYIIGAALLLGLTSQAHGQSGVTAGGEIFCMTKKDHSELLSAAAVNDNRTMAVLLEAKRCGVMKAGFEYRIVNFNIFTSSEIRVFYSGGMMDVWGSGDLWMKGARKKEAEKDKAVTGQALRDGM